MPIKNFIKTLKNLAKVQNLPLDLANEELVLNYYNEG